MKREIILPPLGEDVKEVEVSFWLKEEGEEVKKGEELVEVITDKAVFRVEAPGEGILEKIIVGEGKKVKVGETLGVIREKP